MIKVIKRDGSIVDFDLDKISIAIAGAFDEVGKQEFDDVNVLNDIEDICDSFGIIDVEAIQDIVEIALMKHEYYEEAKAYVRYRYVHELVRQSNTTDQTIKELLNGESEYWNTENSNKNAIVAHTQRDYLAGITSTDITRRFLLPKDIVEAHDEGIIHFHDADYFAQNALHNCELINLEDMLQNGTIINDVMIESPHRIITAATIATQIIAAVTSSSYGGASISLTHLAPFVRSSYEQYYNKYRNWGFADFEAEQMAELDTRKEIKDAVQTFLYQTNSMTNTNGQSPFLSVFMYLNETDEYKEELAMLIEEFLKQRILGFKNKKGVYVAPAFPKYLYVLEEDNIHEDSPYWYLTELAAECTAKRMVPDYISEKVMKQLKIDANGDGQCYACMGCRSFLLPYIDENGKPKYYGRFNGGVVTINLGDVALSAVKYAQDNNWYCQSVSDNMMPIYMQESIEEKFWEILAERMELVHRALQIRYNRLAGVTSDVAPILWQNGALARLQPGESIKPLLHNNYSTFSIGYSGLYEAVKVMTGKSHTDKAEGEDFGLRVMQYLNDKAAQWREEENIGYSVYGSPIESVTYKFAKALQKRFGIIEGITDRGYVTNSYHVPVFEEINAFDKLAIESRFQALSPGGAISYIEAPDLKHNIPAILAVIKFIYNNIMYAEINTKIDYCMACGYDGEMEITDDYGWKCPNCGNTDQNQMNVTRRTCGYLGSHYWNKGRTQEIKERVVHLDDKLFEE